MFAENGFSSRVCLNASSRPSVAGRSLGPGLGSDFDLGRCAFMLASYKEAHGTEIAGSPFKYMYHLIRTGHFCPQSESSSCPITAPL